MSSLGSSTLEGEDDGVLNPVSLLSESSCADNDAVALNDSGGSIGALSDDETPLVIPFIVVWVNREVVLSL